MKFPIALVFAIAALLPGVCASAALVRQQSGSGSFVAEALDEWNHASAWREPWTVQVADRESEQSG